ncbi:MAG: hypothetical protein LBR72_04035 [Oscillospiraceae bacterium]|jgi:hypothetical protein|nr:hypothetical protein [Oscillospiraceae bacterium]
MGFFDILKQQAQSALSSGIRQGVSGAAGSAMNAIRNRPQSGGDSVTFTFGSLPMSVEQLKSLPEAVLTKPHYTAALTVLALCRYGDSPQDAVGMLNFLKGPQPLSPYEEGFLRDRLNGKAYKPFSFFDGATPGNNYTPAQPYRITVFAGPYSFQEAGYAKLMICSSGADAPREIKLREKPSGAQWFLWENYLLSDIREPNANDPWA